MKNFAKRSFSMLLALCLCLSLLSGIALPEASAASYVHNWGTRGTVADEDDFTRSTAEEWYKAEGTSYEELSQLSGSTIQSSVPSSALYKELKSLMTDAHSYKTSYDATKEMYRYTDCQNGGGKISSFYSGNSIGPGWGEGGSWNREHTWPKSKSLNGNSNGGQDETDIMMLRPTSTSENSSRGNTAYGENYYHPNSESDGKYDLRGDCARICLYVYVRWGNTSYMWGSSGVMESRATLLKWMEEDPVDTWELGRNDSVQSITGTRNVFVDYPELCFIMFGEDVPDNYSTPSGAGNAVSYNITATSNNTSYGTVSLSGKTITATPKTGYYVSGYTITSGSATVVQSGNTFKVTPNSDCSIRINFSAKTAVTVTFMENGISAKTINSYGGDSVTLPSNTNTPAEGYSFLGWTDGLVNDTTTKPTIYNAGASVSASNKTYYAVYSYSVGGTGVTEWSLKNLSEIKTGDVFLITMEKSGTIYALPNTTASSAPAPVTVLAANGKLTAEPAANLLWNKSGSTDAWIFYPNGVTSRWLSATADNAGVRVDTGANKTFKLDSNYLYNIGTGRYFGVYNGQDWRCYTSSSTNIGGQTLGFYVKSESGTTYYTTSTFVCEHEDSGATSAVAATCTTTGYTAGVFCNDCEQYLSGHEVVPALGHSWGAWVQTTAPTCTAAGTETSTCIRCSETKTQSVAAKGHSYTSVVTKPTETQQGYTTYTCTTCGHSYKDNYTEATGQTFYVSFCVPKDVASVATMACGKDGITLPSAAAPEGYTFLGWTTEAVEDTETQPTILTGSYNATQNTTLYALYSYVEVEEGQTANEYALYSGELTEGDYVIYYKTDALVAADADNSGRMDAVSVTVTNNTITNPDSSIVWHIAPTADKHYTIYNEANGVYAAGTGSKNKSAVITSVTDYAKWTVTGTSTYEFKNLGNTNKGVNALLRWNSTSIGWACYSSSTGNAVSLYKGYSGTTYYTTLTTLDPVAAVDGVEYASFEAAYAACGEGQIIELLTTIGEGDPISITLDKDLYIDLSGCELYADVTANGYSVYGKDSVTDTYASDDFGSLTLTGDVTVNSQDGYAAYDWGQNEWSFHAYEVKLVAVSLKPGSDALGYKAQFFGDEIVSDMVTSFGFNLWVNPDNVITQSYESATNEQIISLRLQGIMAANGGEIPIYANAFVTFSNEDPWTTDTYSTTLRSAMEAVSANIQNYDTQQIIALQTYIESHAAKMTAWDIDPIKQWSAI